MDQSRAELLSEINMSMLLMKGLCSSFICSTVADAGTTDTVDSIMDDAGVGPQNEDTMK